MGRGNVKDNTTNLTAKPFGYRPPASIYKYDHNGNLKKDTGKNLNISYNVLNLPQKVWNTLDKTDYLKIDYTFAGEKIRKREYENGTIKEDRFYLGGVEFVNSIAETYSHSKVLTQLNLNLHMIWNKINSILLFVLFASLIDGCHPVNNKGISENITNLESEMNSYLQGEKSELSVDNEKLFYFYSLALSKDPFKETSSKESSFKGQKSLHEKVEILLQNSLLNKWYAFNDAEYQLKFMSFYRNDSYSLFFLSLNDSPQGFYIKTVDNFYFVDCRHYVDKGSYSFAPFEDISSICTINEEFLIQTTLILFKGKIVYIQENLNNNESVYYYIMPKEDSRYETIDSLTTMPNIEKIFTKQLIPITRSSRKDDFYLSPYRI